MSSATRSYQLLNDMVTRHGTTVPQSYIEKATSHIEVCFGAAYDTCRLRQAPMKNYVLSTVGRTTRMMIAAVRYHALGLNLFRGCERG